MGVLRCWWWIRTFFWNINQSRLGRILAYGGTAVVVVVVILSASFLTADKKDKAGAAVSEIATGDLTISFTSINTSGTSYHYDAGCKDLRKKYRAAEFASAHGYGALGHSC
jgi:hypothetical protein